MAKSSIIFLSYSGMYILNI